MPARRRVADAPRGVLQPLPCGGDRVIGRSSEHREPALAGELVERGLHPARTSASTSSTSGSSPNSARMSMGSSTWVTILVGSGRLGGKPKVRPNGKPIVTGAYVGAQQLVEAQQPGEPLAAPQVELVLLAAVADDRHDRHVRLERGADVALAAVEVDRRSRPRSAGTCRSPRRGTRSSPRRAAAPRRRSRASPRTNPARRIELSIEPVNSMSWASVYSGRSGPKWSWNATAMIGTSIAISPPEWLETISAPPSAGIVSMSRTSERYQS